MVNSKDIRQVMVLVLIGVIVVGGFFGSLYLYNNPHILGTNTQPTPDKPRCETISVEETTQLKYEHKMCDNQPTTTVYYKRNGLWEMYTP
jgi:hypothetical protein